MACDTAYYHLRVERLDTDATFREKPSHWSDIETVHDGETGKDWYLDGIDIGLPLDERDQEALLREWGQTGDAVRCSVEDNGEDGDGLWLTIAPTVRAGNPATKPLRWCDGEPMPIVRLRLSPQQASVLAGALAAAAGLRRAEVPRG